MPIETLQYGHTSLRRRILGERFSGPTAGRAGGSSAGVPVSWASLIGLWIPGSAAWLLGGSELVHVRPGGDVSGQAKLDRLCSSDFRFRQAGR